MVSEETGQLSAEIKSQRKVWQGRSVPACRDNPSFSAGLALANLGSERGLSPKKRQQRRRVQQVIYKVADLPCWRAHFTFAARQKERMAVNAFEEL